MRTLDDIKPGQTIGRYEFLVPIARGGMAAVWAARLKGTRGFAKTVAIKTMLPTLSDDPLFEQMFLDEAQLAAQIHHPNVVEIMDLGEEHDVLYQVMEYVDGESLGQILRVVAKEQKRIPIEVGVRMMSDACSGLHAAHELKSVDGTHLGLVHRDISPQNILITYDGVLKIVDFGVAKAAGRTASETTAGQVKGKAPYMSPEQALGKPIDRRTDIFAMGIVLYQIATGKHPFRGESDIATLHNILYKDVPSPRFVDPKFPRPLESVINRALSRDPTKRFQTAAEMASALQRVFPPTTRPAEISDVGAFLQSLMGDVGTKRRKALGEAIRRADTRTATSAPVESSAATLLPLADILSDVSSAVTSSKHVAEPTQRIDQVAGSDLLGRASSPGLDGLMRASAPDLPPPPRVSQPSSPALGAPLQQIGEVAVFEAGAESPRASQPEADGDVAVVPQRSSRMWIPLVAVALLSVIAAAVAGFVVLRGRAALGKPIGEATTSTGAATTSAPSGGNGSPNPSQTAAVDPNTPVYDINSVGEPVVDPTAPPSGVATGGNTLPVGSVRPPRSADVPSGSAPPLSTWKPPPVSDPGF